MTVSTLAEQQNNFFFFLNDDVSVSPQDVFI